MAAIASHRYAIADSSSPSSSSPSSSSSDPKKKSKNAASALQRLISNTAAAAAPDSSSRALAKVQHGGLRAPASAGQNLSGLVKKFIEKRSHPKSGGANRKAVTLIAPSDPIAADLKKACAAAKGSNLSALSRKLFQKSGSSGKGAPALTEVKTNTRTLSMVLRSERELLAQNEEYEGRVSELLLLVEGKDREIGKLKDLCFKQREEIKALKDAILFPDVMNSQLQKLLEEQGSEMKHAKHAIPSLQKQVTSLTKQLKCLTESLAEVKAEKYVANQSFNGHISSPTTPMIKETANSLDYNSGGPMTSVYDSPDEMFLKDLNPCLTPCFQKEQYEVGCDFPKVELFESIAASRDVL